MRKYLALIAVGEPKTISKRKRLKGEIHKIYKIKKNRLLPALLVIIMMATLLPVTVFAADPPTLILISADVTTDGGGGLTFSKEMSPTDLADKIKAGFTITGLDRTFTITNVTLHSTSGGTNNFVQLYLNPAIKGGEPSDLKK